MTETSRTHSQDDPYPDEDLLQGLQRLTPGHYYGLEVARSNETEGSLLLDPINSYIQSSQSAIEPIPETAEEQQEAFPPPEMPSSMTNLALDQEPHLEIIREANSQSDRNVSLAQPTEDPLPIQLAAVVSSPEKQPQAGDRQNFLLGFSHYNSKNEESIGKTDLNSSLYVEISNQKAAEINFQDLTENYNVRQEDHEVPNYEGSTIASSNIVVEVDLRGEINQNERFFYQKQLIQQQPLEEDRRPDQFSNDSIDSSKLALLPIEYLPSERCTITERIEQTENEHLNSPIAEQKCEKNVDLMLEQFDHIRQEPIPMDIECPYQKLQEIPMEIQGYSKPLNIPMDIETDEFSYQGLNAIALDPIQQQANQPLEQLERAQEQEMLDSMSAHPIPAHQLLEPYKEFTFGKEEVQPHVSNIYDQAVEASLKSMEKYINIEADANNKVAQSKEIGQTDPAQNDSFWNELREENLQNLSMNVEHDNNFSNALQDVQEIMEYPSKNENLEINLNNSEPILTNLIEVEEQQMPAPIQKLKANSFYEEEVPKPNEREFKVQNRRYYASEQLEEQIQENIVNKTEQKDHNLKQYEYYDEVVPIEVIDVQARNDEIQTSSISDQHHQSIQSSQKSVVQVSASQLQAKMSKSKKCAIHHNIWSYIYEKPPAQVPITQPSNLQHPQQQPTSRNEQFIAPYMQHPLNYFYNQPVIPVYQPVYQVPAQPWITINYRQNEASISLFGSAALTGNKNEPATEQVNQLPKIINEFVAPRLISERDHSKQLMEVSAKDIVPMRLELKECPQPIKSPAKKILIKQYTNSCIQTVQESTQNTVNQQLSNKKEPMLDINERCNCLLSKCQNYLLQFEYATECDHKQFEKSIIQDVLLRFTPEPKSQAGMLLFKNGLFLVALVKLITRSSPTPFIFCYMYEYLDNAYGHFLQRNSYFFKCESQKAKKNYQIALEKKYSDMLDTQRPHPKQEKEEKPIKRNSISHNIFYSIPGYQVQKAEIGLQIQPTKQTSPTNHKKPASKKEKEPEQKAINIETAEIQHILKNSSSIEDSQEAIKPNLTKTASPSTATNTVQQLANKKAQIVKSEAVQPLPVVTKLSPTQNQKQIKPEIVKETSNKKDTEAENKIKKNIEQIRLSFGSYGKRNDATEISQTSRFKELYDKYQHLQSRPDLLDSASIKKNVVSQAVKNNEKVVQAEVEKKPIKKHVAFHEQLLKPDLTENEDETDEDHNKKKKLKKKPKSKKDKSEDSEQEDSGVFIKTRRSHSKKEK